MSYRAWPCRVLTTATFAISCYGGAALSAQAPTASLVVTVLDDSGKPVPSALVSSERAASRAEATGRAKLVGLRVGMVHIVVRMIGYSPRDTTLLVGPRGVSSWTAVLSEFPSLADRQAAQAAYDREVAAGGIDSVASGLVKLDTAGVFDFARFGIGLLASEVRRHSGAQNVVASPLGAGQALGLALLAARDSTADAIARTLRLDALSTGSLAERVGRFNRALLQRRDVTLRASNAIWIDDSVAIAPDFEQQAHTTYAAVARTVPLHSAEVVPVINHWADSTTSGRIPSVIEGPYGGGIMVVLMNAVYFHGFWLGPFAKQDTRDRPFTSAISSTALVPTMEKRGSWAYRRGVGFQSLRIPYRTGLTAFYVVLPDSGVSAATLLETFEQQGWPAPDPVRETRSVHLQLPRLHLEATLNLVAPLSSLGGEIAFDPLRADFSGLVNLRPSDPPWCPPLSSGRWADPCTRYRIAEATQKVYLDLDEEGTEAAAVTSMLMELVTTASESPIEFLVNHPFLFAIRDERSGTLLFAGYIAMPGA